MNSRVVFSHNGIILNACCLMNLSASGCMGDILQSLPVAATIGSYLFEQEKLSIYCEATDDEKPLMEPINLQSLIQTGLLKVASLSSYEERMSSSDFAAAFGHDCEAEAAALALHRHWSIGVDYPATVALFRRHARQLPLLSTPLLVKHWVESLSPSPDEIARVMHNIRRRALYLPPPSHPLFAWWTSYLDQ